MKYYSKTNPKLSFFVEPADKFYFAICAQVDGFPAHEVWNDWMADRAGAECIAEQLANGDIPYIHKCRKRYGAGCEVCQSETDAKVAAERHNTKRQREVFGWSDEDQAEEDKRAYKQKILILGAVLIAILFLCVLFPNGF